MREERLPLDYMLTRQDMHLPASLEEVRILMVVDGNCQVIKDSGKLTLHKSDYLLINVLEEVRLVLKPGSYVAVLSLPYFELLRAANRISVRFDLCSLDGKQGKYSETFFMLQGLLMCFVGDIHKEWLKAMGLYCLLLENLVSNYSLIPPKDSRSDGQEEKITQIMQYIWANYGQEISMTEIAEKVFLSRSVASRLFKQTTGENFPDYLKKLRLTSVKRALEQTDLSITQIALESGFSSPSVLNRTFRESLGVSPTDYRKAYKENLKQKAAINLQLFL